MSDRRPRDGPAGSWTADVTSSAPSGRRPMSHMAPYMGSGRSARPEPFVGVLDGVAEARTGRQRGRWPRRGVPACPSGASPHRSCGSSSRSRLSASSVRGRLTRVLRAAFTAPLGAELWCPHHPAIWTRLQDGQGLAAVPDRFIRHDITAFGGDAFGVADFGTGVVRLTNPPLGRVTSVLVGWHHSDPSGRRPIAALVLANSPRHSMATRSYARAASTGSSKDSRHTVSPLTISRAHQR